MKLNKQTFNKILEQIEQSNSERLMEKARLANKIAKKSCGVNRRKAYDVKATALCFLVRKLSSYVRVSEDIRLPDFIVVGLKKEHSGLHLPFAKLAD